MYCSLETKFKKNCNDWSRVYILTSSNQFSEVLTSDEIRYDWQKISNFWFKLLFVRNPLN